MTFHEWLDKHQPIKNHFDDNASYDGCQFETFGDEVEYVMEQNECCVWTIIEADGEFWISPGRHFVNRMGYLICNVPFDPNNPPDDIHDED